MMEFFAHVRKEGKDFLVSFPDFPSINTYGTSLSEALASAKEALNGALEADFERGYALPAPRNFEDKRSYHPIALMPHIELAHTLKRIRNSHSQTDIAKRLGISYQAYQKLENPRKCNPTVKTLEKISEVLGKDLAILFRDRVVSGTDKPRARPSRPSLSRSRPAPTPARKRRAAP